MEGSVRVETPGQSNFIPKDLLNLYMGTLMKETLALPQEERGSGHEPQNVEGVAQFGVWPKEGRNKNFTGERV